LTCRSCATCMHSDALRCNQMSSDVIGCHRMSSAGITPACPVGLAPGLRGTRRGRRYCGEGASAVVSICMHSAVIRWHQVSSAGIAPSSEQPDERRGRIPTAVAYRYLLLIQQRGASRQCRCHAVIRRAGRRRAAAD
jgi:hypothetical protein